MDSFPTNLSGVSKLPSLQKVKHANRAQDNFETESRKFSPAFKGSDEVFSSRFWVKTDPPLERGSIQGI